MRTFNDLTNKIFNRLTVLYDSGEKCGRNIMWICKCDCGNIVKIRGDSIKNGNTKSCGCLQKETVGLLKTTHNCSYKPEYHIWRAMVQRCVNTKNKAYRSYGGRGIKVCDRWLESFENFYADMGPRPNDTSLDRINNDGNYELSNCRWATILEQMNNTSRNVFYNYNGTEYTLPQLSRMCGINNESIRWRISNGWTLKDAVETAVK